MSMKASNSSNRHRTLTSFCPEGRLELLLSGWRVRSSNHSLYCYAAIENGDERRDTRTFGALSRPNSGCCGPFSLQHNRHDKAAACDGCWRALEVLMDGSRSLLTETSWAPPLLMFLFETLGEARAGPMASGGHFIKVDLDYVFLAYKGEGLRVARPIEQHAAITGTKGGRRGWSPSQSRRVAQEIPALAHAPPPPPPAPQPVPCHRGREDDERGAQTYDMMVVDNSQL
ncbi:hypothetical protein Tco_0787385 [Tanacetum coccineum]